MNVRILTASAFAAAFAVSGCGYSEEEWQAQLDKYNQLLAEKNSNDQAAAAAQKKLAAELAAEQAKVSDLTKKLSDAGVDISKLNESLQASATKVSFTFLSWSVPSQVPRITASVVWSEFFASGFT